MYLDVLFLENLFINYIILFLTQRFSKKYSSPLKLFLGALIGTIYVLIFFLAPYNFFKEFLAKILLSLLIIYMAFNPETLKEFFRILAVFYLVSFTIGGAILAFLYIVKWKTSAFIAGIGVTVILLFISWDYAVKKTKEDKGRYEILIEMFGEKAEVPGFLDTGNRLTDPFFNFPVIVVPYVLLEKFLPGELIKILKKGDMEFIREMNWMAQDDRWYSRLVIIPFSGIGSKGLMIGIRPDRVMINGKEVKDVILGISSNDMEFALLNPEIID
ncbi:sigma-E processing peptidase SpoIIGA [Caldanaerobacter sp.]|uniref:sigma-E processing peptidase SpoIIGA n=1 Tax=Caldanaerobacter sp. TaxID=2930036 RepID=UPI003C7926E6